MEEKGVSDVVTVFMYQWFWELLKHYLRTHPIAQSMVLEMGFRLKNEVRRPDLGVVKNDNPIPLKPTDKSYKGIYDLCIEAISDSKPKDIKRDTIDKKAEYANSGVKEYYILDGHDRYMAFYRLNQSGLYEPIQSLPSDIIQSTVLPGFQFRYADLFTKPSLDEMIDDPVYQNFVLPEYREAKQQIKQEQQARQLAETRALQAEAQVRTEKEARQQAQQRAEQLTKQLRALGIEPDNF
ncbi:conserved hypothetical protein [Beggiatoa sp. PS]|nr:conserved hypothetical protein [Beggiatoa sp. PS]